MASAWCDRIVDATDRIELDMKLFITLERLGTRLVTSAEAAHCPRRRLCNVLDIVGWIML
jgi:tRNA A37 threonylcarbamoyladenosine dehydratase